MRKAPAYMLSSVDNALLLATILRTEGSISITEAAERLGVAVSTAHRLLSMLVYRDFAMQGTDRRYRAGTAFSLGNHRALGTNLLRDASLQHLEELSRHTRESANVFVRAGAFVHFVASWEGDRQLRVGTREGMTLPAHLTSGGLVLLSALTDAEVAAIFAETQWEERSTDRPKLSAVITELNRVRKNGFAFARSLSEQGVAALAVALTVPGLAPAAISLSMPALRFDPTRVDEWVHDLRVTAGRIEADLREALQSTGEAAADGAELGPSSRLTE